MEKKSMTVGASISNVLNAAAIIVWYDTFGVWGAIGCAAVFILAFLIVAHVYDLDILN